MVVGGEVLRKGAMITARTNFNHYVQHVKHEGHELVTCGVYNWMRHPSYVGWFYWSIGTQVCLLHNIFILLLFVRQYIGILCMLFLPNYETDVFSFTFRLGTARIKNNILKAEVE